MLLKIIVGVTQIKTLVLNVSKYIITSILVLPTRFAVKLAIILVSTFITAVMLYIYQIRHHISFCRASNKTWCIQTSYCMLVHCFIFLHVYCAIWKFITKKPSSLVNFQLNSACTWRLHIVIVLKCTWRLHIISVKVDDRPFSHFLLDFVFIRSYFPFKFGKGSTFMQNSIKLAFIFHIICTKF